MSAWFVAVVIKCTVSEQSLCRRCWLNYLIEKVITDGPGKKVLELDILSQRCSPGDIGILLQKC